MRTLRTSGVFDMEQPVGLLRKVFLEVMYYLYRRGEQNLRELKASDFTIVKGKDGIECVIKISCELDKNHKEDSHEQAEGVMLATGRSNCPVKAFKKYLDKISPKQTAFFQRPKTNAPHFGPWFDNIPIGEKMLGKMMKNISREAKLTMLYTNHCIRATTITYLDQAGYPARHIMSVGGHRSEASIRSYSKTSTEKRKEMSSLLSAKSLMSALENDQRPSTSAFMSALENDQRPSFSGLSAAPSSEKRKHPTFRSYRDYQQIQQRTMAERFNLDTFIPRFDLTSGIFSDDDDTQDIL